MSMCKTSQTSSLHQAVRSVLPLPEGEATCGCVKAAAGGGTLGPETWDEGLLRGRPVSQGSLANLTKML